MFKYLNAYRDMIDTTPNVVEISKKRDNAQFKKNSKSYFQLFFLLKLALSNPIFLRLKNLSLYI